jgi:hypothetical protein
MIRLSRSTRRTTIVPHVTMEWSTRRGEVEMRYLSTPIPSLQYSRVRLPPSLRSRQRVSSTCSGTPAVMRLLMQCGEVGGGRRMGRPRACGCRVRRGTELRGEGVISQRSLSRPSSTLRLGLVASTGYGEKSHREIVLNGPTEESITHSTNQAQT